MQTIYVTFRLHGFIWLNFQMRKRHILLPAPFNASRLLCLALFLIALGASAQPTADRFAGYIRPEEMKENLTIIASDAMEGRSTGSRGQKMAAAFIRHHFETVGLTGPLDGSYYQPYELFALQPGTAQLTANNNAFENFTDFVFTGMWNGTLNGDLVFAGNATEKELKKIDVANKAVLAWWQGFSFGEARQVTERLYEAGAKLVLLYVDEKPSDFRAFARQNRELLADKTYHLAQPHADENLTSPVFVSEQVVQACFGDVRKLKNQRETPGRVKAVPFEFRAEAEPETLRTENVLGYLEGTDKKNEVLVITAHFDHIGKNRTGSDLINNGADDDGSGTVAVMQLATAFAEAKKQGAGPRRSILFMTVSGEEWGLFGSEHYTNHPVFPLRNTVVNLNMDMIGRRDGPHKTTEDYVYVIGSDKLSSELHEINERNNASYTRLLFDYTYNEINHPTQLYQRSDHWNFARNRVPIIFYFDGIHEDYHRPSDEVSKIDFALLAKRTQLVFYTAWEIANREDRLKVDK